MKLRTILPVSLLLLSGAGGASPPLVGLAPMDRCLTYITDCDKAAADYWCQVEGFGKAKSFKKLEPDDGKTRHLGDSGWCTTGVCEAIVPVCAGAAKLDVARLDAVAGDWVGQAECGGVPLDLTVHVQRGAGLRVTGTIDWTRQGVMEQTTSKLEGWYKLDKIAERQKLVLKFDGMAENQTGYVGTPNLYGVVDGDLVYGTVSNCGDLTLRRTADAAPVPAEHFQKTFTGKWKLFIPSAWHETKRIERSDGTVTTKHEYGSGADGGKLQIDAGGTFKWGKAKGKWEQVAGQRAIVLRNIDGRDWTATISYGPVHDELMLTDAIGVRITGSRR
jgi:hypothetical protein